jgi:dTDP-4-amino-4,6-dideoxygalactose transaminase
MAKKKAVKGKAKNITASYDTGDGVKIKVKYAFFGSIYGKEEQAMMAKVAKQDSFTSGPMVERFQKEFAAKHQVKLAMASSNCTTAMHTMSQLWNLKKGDEVIVTPLTFLATSLAIVKEHATPVYADINPRTFNIDPDEIAKKITKKTKAIYVVHYGGQMCDMDPIMALAKKHGLKVLEDCAHTPGASYKGRPAGSIGDCGCFSFHSLKNMTTLGEGGMITTNHAEYAQDIQLLRCMNISHWDQKLTDFKYGEYKFKKKKGDYWVPSHFDAKTVRGNWGNNYRMNEFQAAAGIAQLAKLDKHNEMRRRIGRAINDGIKNVRGVTPVYESPDCYHIYHLYTLLVDPKVLGASRDDFMRALYVDGGVQGILHYQPTYHLDGFRKLGLDTPKNRCPKAEHFFYASQLNLPINPRITDKEIDYMISGIRNAAKKVGR